MCYLLFPSDNFFLNLFPFRDSTEARLCKGINKERDKEEIIFRIGSGKEKQSFAVGLSEWKLNSSDKLSPFIEIRTPLRENFLTAFQMFSHSPSDLTPPPYYLTPIWNFFRRLNVRWLRYWWADASDKNKTSLHPLFLSFHKKSPNFSR